MKVIPISLQLELAKQLRTFASCMLITRTDGQTFGFTTHDKELQIDGVTYNPITGFAASDIESGNNLDTDNMTVETLQSSDGGITEDALRASYWDYAEFRIFRVNWSDLTMGEIKDRKGHLGKATVKRQTIEAELLGLMEAYGTSVGRVTQAMCDASLGDERCKYGTTGSPPLLSVSGTITQAVGDYFTLRDPARTEASGIFNEGTLTINYTTGPLTFEVKSYEPGEWSTKTPMPYLATGLTYTMNEGCDRLFDTCVSRFGNAANFRGQPHLRGNDLLAQVGRHQ